jgi:predicted ester cyclase
MGIEENKEIVKRLFNDSNDMDILNDNDAHLNLTRKYMHPNYILHHAVGDLTLEQDQQMHTMFFKAFPDIHMEIEDIFGADDKVFARIRVSGTHTGEFQGYAATGKQINTVEAFVFRISNAKFAEAWNFLDTLAMYSQLGLTPPS